MKGILFKPDMIKAIAEGRKTVTRRLMKLNIGFGYEVPDPTVSDEQFKKNLGLIGIGSPYKVGEVVYIKEAWRAGIREDNVYLTLYKSGGSKLGLCDPATHHFAHYECRWQSPLFMPAWAARYFIEITGVSPERLQEIHYYEIPQEGIQDDTWSLGKNRFAKKTPTRLISDFKHVWNSINPKHPWESNPWVWRYCFKRVEQIC